jgi:predicted acylesterase/phospholipase RssA
MSKRVALVLGSGGARGYAHIGVIDELTARGYEIVGLSGSSMGALVGGLQAAGKLDEYAEWARSLTQRAVLRLLDPSIATAGVLRAGKILDAVRDILGEVCIEDLPVPYTAVATDLIAGRSVWLQRGPVDAAIRASIAIRASSPRTSSTAACSPTAASSTHCRWRRSRPSTPTSPSPSASAAVNPAVAPNRSTTTCSPTRNG